MKFEWDEKKARSNKAKHGVSFDIAPRMDLKNADVSVDSDLDYGEERLIATGLIDVDLYVMVYTERDDVIRVISLRRATKWEIDGYFQVSPG